METVYLTVEQIETLARLVRDDEPNVGVQITSDARDNTPAVFAAVIGDSTATVTCPYDGGKDEKWRF